MQDDGEVLQCKASVSRSWNGPGGWTDLEGSPVVFDDEEYLHENGMVLDRQRLGIPRECLRESVRDEVSCQEKVRAVLSEALERNEERPCVSI